MKLIRAKGIAPISKSFPASVKSLYIRLKRWMSTQRVLLLRCVEFGAEDQVPDFQQD